ncbi:MAG TPA: type II secretion system minor pseudopilin GspH [Gammaproteobacteria bacterium]|nr:type II secretion system minor pseudopilin GspH [Gammaproteobacteria bacterium]
MLENRDSRRARDRGFTLFEILVALVIIGLIVGVATLAIHNPAPDKLREEARRLEALISLAQEEAILQSRDFGLSFWQQGYSFNEYSEGKWIKVEKDSTFRTHQLPEGMRLQLTLEGIDVVMKPIEPEKPQVFVLSSGEMSPFKLRLKFLDLPAFYTELSADALGTLEHTDSEQEANEKSRPTNDKFRPANKKT